MTREATPVELKKSLTPHGHHRVKQALDSLHCLVTGVQFLKTSNSPTVAVNWLSGVNVVVQRARTLCAVKA